MGLVVLVAAVAAVMRPASRGVAASAIQMSTGIRGVLPQSKDVPKLERSQVARTIATSALRGVLSSVTGDGPVASPVNFVVNPAGEPIFALGQQMVESRQLSEAKTALVVTPDLLAANEDVTTLPSVTLGGALIPLPEHEFADSHVHFLNVHPVARDCIKTGDINFWKMAVQSCFLSDGDGAGAWLSVDEYMTATVDSLANCAKGIVASVNQVQCRELQTFCELHFGGELGACRLASVDELGFDVSIASPVMSGNTERRRVAFAKPLKTEQEARSFFVKAFFQADELHAAVGEMALDSGDAEAAAQAA